MRRRSLNFPPTVAPTREPGSCAIQCSKLAPFFAAGPLLQEQLCAPGKRQRKRLPGRERSEGPPGGARAPGAPNARDGSGRPPARASRLRFRAHALRSPPMRTVKDVEAYLERLHRRYRAVDGQSGTFLVESSDNTPPVAVRVDPPLVVVRVHLGDVKNASDPP